MSLGLFWQYLRSLAFTVQIYVVMVAMAVVVTPLALLNRRIALAGARAWCRWVRWTAAWMVGLKSEIRGPVPHEEVLVAAKHQSFFDVILLLSVLPRPSFVMKKDLLRLPIFGFYARRIGCVAIDRSKKGAALRRMLQELKTSVGEASEPRQIVIYPQGTRVPPGAQESYKIGTGALYRALSLPCVPVACNVGLFWPRRALLRKKGVAVVEFLPRIPPGLELEAFMAHLERVIEEHSDALMAEANLGSAVPANAQRAPTR